MQRYVQIPSGLRPEIGERSLWRFENHSIAVFNVAGVLYAIADSCPHAGASLSNGNLEGCVVQCRAHGLKFDLSTGCMPHTAGLRVRTYPVEILGGHPFVVLNA
jgi:3-phenylpropionate/trans-cinnamate dioxygenase ferredoxin subunit